jgi:hypothetical protein
VESVKLNDAFGSNDDGSNDVLKNDDGLNGAYGLTDDGLTDDVLKIDDGLIDDGLTDDGLNDALNESDASNDETVPLLQMIGDVYEILVH